MIEKVSDLLQALIKAEAQKIEEQHIQHRVTIGNMYEGLTADIIGKSLFGSLNLQVINNSFIKGKNGVLSKEMDVMVITGEAEQLPYSDQYKVEPEQVIAVIQVKKKLNKQQLADAHENLKDVYDIADWETITPAQQQIYRDAFRTICQKDLIVDGKIRTNFDNETERQVFYMLFFEAVMPVRIVMGYEGYTTEHGLRQGFVEYLKDNISTTEKQQGGFSPLTFPNLIINQGFSLLKGNSMPYVGPMYKGRWIFYFSNSQNPLMHLLEMIWTRLSYLYDIPADVFGEDLELEGLNTLLIGNPVTTDQMSGWNYDIIETSAQELEKAANERREWEPVKLSFDQHVIVYALIQQDTLPISAIPKLIKKDNDFDTAGFVQTLFETGLLLNENGRLRLATVWCRTLYTPEEGFFAADDKTGRLSRWLDKQLAVGRFK
jgi:hypothetical protein